MLDCKYATLAAGVWGATVGLDGGCLNWVSGAGLGGTGSSETCLGKTGLGKARFGGACLGRAVGTRLDAVHIKYSDCKLHEGRNDLPDGWPLRRALLGVRERTGELRTAFFTAVGTDACLTVRVEIGEPK
jgi:hypothetical protein